MLLLLLLLLVDVVGLLLPAVGCWCGWWWCCCCLWDCCCERGERGSACSRLHALLCTHTLFQALFWCLWGLLILASWWQGEGGGPVRLPAADLLLPNFSRTSPPTHAFHSLLLLPSCCRSLTVEHVLPQKPAATSDWGQLFTLDEQEHWVHRLGNLVLLHGRLNSAGSNKSFAEKKRTYWPDRMQYQQTNIPLTDEVAQLARWDPQAVAARQAAVVGHACSCWKLYNFLPREQ